ncbi:hypothetical protein GQ53DRAFT_14541 [Thozetella sp. PMI_491]|nr:hypothetical protein GQ53DRAFT_14541 [Thozetella sp. PMI_491]
MLPLEQLSVEQHLAPASKCPAHPQRNLDQLRWAIAEALQQRQEGILDLLQGLEDAVAVVEYLLNLNLNLGNLGGRACQSVDCALDMEEELGESINFICIYAHFEPRYAQLVCDLVEALGDGIAESRNAGYAAGNRKGVRHDNVRKTLTAAFSLSLADSEERLTLSGTRPLQLRWSIPRSV